MAIASPNPAGRNHIAARDPAPDGLVHLVGGPVTGLAIASLQTRERIDWAQVAELYRRLVDLTCSAVVELNHAVALAQAGEVAAARRRWPRPGWLPLFPLDPRRAVAASGPREEARAAYRRALDLATSTPERRFLTRRPEQL